MKDNWQVIFSGVGGQGLIVSAVAMGEAAIKYEDKNAVMTSSYGVEMRGTFSKSDLIISKDRIDYPEVLEADAVIALAQVAYNKYSNSVSDNTIIIYDCDKVTSNGRQNHKGYAISTLAIEAGGIECANFVALGVMIGMMGIVGIESQKMAIKDSFKGSRFAEQNIKAFELGLKAAGVK